jgi:hypothetical protein
MKPSKLIYKIVNRCGNGCMEIETGTLRIKTIKRVTKFDGWSGYDAYVMQSDSKYPRFASVHAGRFSTLKRKLEKLEGAEIVSENVEDERDMEAQP